MSVEGKFLSKEINDLFWREGLTLVTAESCTAGSVAAAITAVAGSSHFFKGGIIAYSNEIKENLLGVNHGTLETHGAVSEETVVEMVKGAIEVLDTDYAVATSGIAGGLPLSAVTGRAEMMNAVHAGGLGGTYGGNPLACAAARSARGPCRGGRPGTW